MTAAETFEAIDNEIIRAGGANCITFLPIVPELLDHLIGRRVDVVGVQQESGRLPALLLRDRGSAAADDVVAEVAGEMLRLIGRPSHELVLEWAARLRATR